MTTGILSEKIIRGVKLVKKHPELDARFIHDKDQPLSAHNFPLIEKTTWKFSGVKRDAGGILRPFWGHEVTLPTGSPFIPKDHVNGLVSVFEVKSYQHGAPVSNKRLRREAGCL